MKPQSNNSGYVEVDLLESIKKPARITAIKKRPVSGVPSKLEQESATLLNTLALSSPAKPHLINERDGNETVKPLSRVLSKENTMSKVSRSEAVPENLMLGSNADASTVKLRAELRAREGDIENLKAQIAQLLIDRNSQQPKIDNVDIAELQKQFSSQELLLSGYQKENERAMTELVSLKAREKTIAAHLTRLYGANWEDTVLNGSGVQDKQHKIMSPAVTTSPNGTSHSEENADLTSPSKISPNDNARLLAHLSSVQSLLSKMEERLETSTRNLDSREKRAFTALHAV